MAILTEQRAGLTGNSFSFSAADVAGDLFPNTGHALIVNNASGSDITVTFKAQNQCSFQVTTNDHDAQGTVAAGTLKLFGPFDASRFNNTNGRVNVLYSAVSGVSVACVLP